MRQRGEREADKDRGLCGILFAGKGWAGVIIPSSDGVGKEGKGWGRGSMPRS
jgi:hypothetical protein